MRLLWVALVMVWAVHAARAEVQTRAALESRMGARAPAEVAVRNALWAELPAKYVQHPDGVAFELRHGMPGSAKQDVRYTSARFVAEVEAGLNAWATANFTRAQTILEEAIEHARRNPVDVARPPAAQKSMRRALLILALVHKRLAEEAAAQGDAAPHHAERVAFHNAFRDQWLRELMRTFPDAPVTREDLGREAELMYQEAARRFAGEKGRFRIRLAKAMPLMVVSVNERAAQFDTLYERLPGKYRVLVEAPEGARLYEIEVRAGDTLDFTVDWQLDVLFVAAPWVGLQYRFSDEQTLEGALVARVMRGARLREVAVFSVVAADRSFRVRGALYRADGTLLRQGQVTVEGPRHREPLRKLLAYLDGAHDPTVQGVVIGATSGSAHGLVSAPSVAKVATVAPDRSSAALAVGARPRVLSVALIGLGTGAVIFGGVLYYYGSQPPPETPTNQATLFGSKPAGIATGLAGLAAIGAGWWLWSRPVTPVVSVQGDGGTVGVRAAW